MPSINALFLTLDVNDWLLKTHHPRVLHIFDHACNLLNEHKEILSIVMPKIGNGPFNLVVEDDILFSDYLSLEFPISVSSNQLMLGDLAIHTANAKLWNPRPDWERLHAKRDRITKLLLTNYYDRSFNMPIEKQLGLLDHGGLPIPNDCEASRWDQFSNSLISSLSSALANADISTAKVITSQLAGLGAGLTPSGDDFILGALYAAWIIHPYDIASILAGEISNTAAPLTTSLSAAWLRSAGEGKVGDLWHQLFNTLFSGHTERIQETMSKILAIGETSGADALMGFVGTLLCWAGSKVP